MAAVAVPVRRPDRRAGDRAEVPAGPSGCGASPPGLGLLLFFTLAVYEVTSLNCK